jgi:hypothetical protein
VGNPVTTPPARHFRKFRLPLITIPPWILRLLPI